MLRSFYYESAGYQTDIGHIAFVYAFIYVEKNGVVHEVIVGV